MRPRHHDEVPRPSGVQKVDLRAMLEVRRRQENPELGAFRMRAALEQVGIFLSIRTVGRILKANREAEGLSKPRRSPHQKKEMPFEAPYRHEIWTSDVRYIDHSIPQTGQAYVVSILDNHSRAILSSAVTLAQDTNAYLSVLHAAIERHGSPGTIVTDGGGIFKSNRAKAVYRSLGITKEEIERRQPWQSFIVTTFNVQRRMADFHFERAFFSERFSRVLDASGYATLMRWRLYGEEALAGKEANLWLLENTLTLEHAGEPLSAYEVAHDVAGSPDDALGRSGRLAAVRKPTLFESSYVAGQMRLFSLAETLGEDGWLKVLRLEDYAPRSSRQPEMLQQVLFTYTDAI